MSERVRIRKVRMSIRPIPCSECGKMSNPLSLYRGFFALGWFHRACVQRADGDHAVRILLGAMFK